MNGSAGRPYPGTRPFRVEDRHRFFGRTAEAAALGELWRANNLTILNGNAGAGKTSLLSAGVLPVAGGGEVNVLALGRISYGPAYPRAALPPHNPYTLSLLRSWSPGEAVARLVGLTVGEFISRRAERHGDVILAAIDQAEELLADSGPRRAHSRDFFSELTEALRQYPRLHLLLSMREAAADQFEALGGGARYRLAPLSPDCALEAVTGPVRGTGRSFAAGAAERLVRDLTTSRVVAADGQERSVGLDHVEPALLQVVCQRLWESLPVDTDVVSERDVRRYGDVDTTLAAHCGHVIAAVAADHELPTVQLHSWLVRTFVTELGTRGTAYEGPAETAGLSNVVPRALEDRHLLSVEWRSGSRWYQLLSDRLVEPLRRAADVRLPPVEAGEYLRAAGRALALGEIDLAERYAKDALHALPDTDLRQCAEAESLLGNLAYEREEPAEAEAHYRAAARLFEAVRDTAAVGSQLAAVGQTLLAQERTAEAVEELRAAADRIPHDLTVQTELGWALWELGEGRAAAAILTGVLAIDGGDLAALRARGEILVDLGDARNALRDLDRVLRHDLPSTRAARGLARVELGDQDASKEIEGALADAPRNGPVLLYAARAEALSGRRVDAAELARRALNATDPALPPHQREAAVALVGQEPAGRR